MRLRKRLNCYHPVDYNYQIKSIVTVRAKMDRKDIYAMVGTHETAGRRVVVSADVGEGLLESGDLASCEIFTGVAVCGESHGRKHICQHKM